MVELLVVALLILCSTKISFELTNVMNAKALSLMRYQNDINTEHNMKSIFREAVAQWGAWLAIDKREFKTGKAHMNLNKRYLQKILFSIYKILKIIYCS